MMFLFFRKGFLLLVSIILLFVLYLFETNKDEDIGQADYRRQADKELENLEENHPYRRSVYSDKISLDNIERKLALKAKRKIPLSSFKGKYLVALGDSLIEGIGPKYSRGGFISVLERTMNEQGEIVSFQNYGKLGERTGDLINHLKKTQIRSELKKAQISIIAIGSNDLLEIVRDNFTDLSLEVFQEGRLSFEESFRNILLTVQGANPELDSYVLGLYNPLGRIFGDIAELEEIINSWNKSIEEITEEFIGVSYVPIDDLFDGGENLFAEDQFHPNEEGYRRIAERIIDYLLKEGGSALEQ